MFYIIDEHLIISNDIIEVETSDFIIKKRVIFIERNHRSNVLIFNEIRLTFQSIIDWRHFYLKSIENFVNTERELIIMKDRNHEISNAANSSRYLKIYLD